MQKISRLAAPAQNDKGVLYKLELTRRALCAREMAVLCGRSIVDIGQNSYICCKRTVVGIGR